MRKYEEYKNSNVDWVGQIPHHWEVKRLKSFASTIKGKTLEVFDNQIDGSLPNLSLEYLRNDSVVFEAFVKTDNRDFIVDENDLIIVWDGGVGEIFNGKVGVISSTIAKLKFNKSVNVKFFSFIRYDLEYRLKKTPKGICIPHLNPRELNNFMCIIPPKSEQEEIANYLDAKTQVIDKKVTLLEQKIEAYKKLKCTLINQTITKGLNQNVALKDSGVDWIGQIPHHWEVQRLKDVFNTFSGGTPSTKVREYWNGNLPWIPSGKVQNNVISKKVVEDFITQDALKESSTKMAKLGSILIALTGATCSNVGLLTFDTTINQSIVALNQKKDIEKKYYFYFLLSASSKIRSSMTGGAQAGVNQEDVKFLDLLLPPKSEQEEIANYLDAKTQAIDKKISLLEQKIDTYKKLKHTLINQTITKGLDKNVPLKDSGISWIGQIPQHWEVKRFKDVLLKNDGGVWGEFVDDGTIVLRSTEVDIDGKWKIDNPAICKLTSKEIKSSLLEKGDLLITKSSGSDLHIGKTAFVDDYVAGLQCCYSNFMQRLRINTKNYSKYYFWFLNSEISKLQYLYNTKSTTGLGNLSSEIFNLLLTVVPPKSEQEEIAKYLDHKTATIDAIVNNIGKQIEILEQLRKTLINEVVTGKIKVVE